MKTLKSVTIQTDSLLTIKEASEILKISRMTIYRWIKAKKIRAINFGYTTYVPREDIERLKK